MLPGPGKLHIHEYRYLLTAFLTQAISIHVFAGTLLQTPVSIAYEKLLFAYIFQISCL